MRRRWHSWCGRADGTTYEPLHPNGHTTFNWDCGHDSGYDTRVGCAGDAGFAVANMPSSVEQIFSDLGDDVCKCVYRGEAQTLDS